ncbi:MAG: heparinase [Phycisphaerae bacterium]|nr:heparinase [Phycisphaerae bacterium]
MNKYIWICIFLFMEWFGLGGQIIGAESKLEWQNVDRVKIPISPGEHPRLYLRAEQAKQLPEQLKHPVLAPVVERLQKLAARSKAFAAEWEALQYLATRDPAQGRAAINRAIVELKKCELADRMDACRATGRMMVTGAIVYDWCYGLLTTEEKKAFVTELIRLAKTQECGYPPVRQSSVTGHASEAQIMRDMLSAGIAIYDEDPEMYQVAAGRFISEHLPVRNWLYTGHAYHQGDSYGPYRFSWDCYPLMIFDRLGAGNVYNPEQRFVPYLWIYSTRPDGQRLRAGDTYMNSRRPDQPWGEGDGTMLIASFYGDGTLLSQFLRQGGSADNECIFEFLWRDPDLEAKPIDSLPLSRYFGSPFGWMVARTSWGDDAVIAEMKINEYNFVNHQHLDAGAFQIYYRGALAIDSGLYKGSSGGYGSPHCMNYSWRTIAHNSLLIFDPKESFGKAGYGNDGGQRLPNGRSEARSLEVMQKPENGYRTGRVISQGFGPDPKRPEFTLLQGDITEAYSKKVKQVTRSFVFFNLGDAKVPAAMVAFDRIISADPTFRKFWLLHSLEEPRIGKESAIVDCTQNGATGQLTLDVLLPSSENLSLDKIGGPGKEYWVFGTNYDNIPDGGIAKRNTMELGDWRIEVSPKQPAAADLFLTVIQVSDRGSNMRLPVHRIETADRVGCFVEREGKGRVVLFSRDGKRSGQGVAFEIPGQGGYGILVADLEPGDWIAQQEGDNQTQTMRVSEESCAAWFEGPAGQWKLSKK